MQKILYERLFSKDGNGFINRQELSVVMRNIGQRLTQTEIQVQWNYQGIVKNGLKPPLQDMIDDADLDGDGQINYEEFYNMMSNN